MLKKVYEAQLSIFITAFDGLQKVLESKPSQYTDKSQKPCCKSSNTLCTMPLTEDNSDINGIGYKVET